MRTTAMFLMLLLAPTLALAGSWTLVTTAEQDTFLTAQAQLEGTTEAALAQAYGVQGVEQMRLWHLREAARQESDQARRTVGAQGGLNTASAWGAVVVASVWGVGGWMLHVMLLWAIGYLCWEAPWCRRLLFGVVRRLYPRSLED